MSPRPAKMSPAVIPRTEPAAGPPPISAARRTVASFGGDRRPAGLRRGVGRDGSGMGVGREWDGTGRSGHREGTKGAMVPTIRPKGGGATCLSPPPNTGWPFSGKSNPLGPIGQKNPNLAELAHDNKLHGPFLFQRTIFHSEKALLDPQGPFLA